jgi:photosystem II stability/assembly factor-like uncharacterized protein
VKIMVLVCLSPNGVDTYELTQQPDKLLVATQKGVVHVERKPDAQHWSVAGTSLDGLHISSLMREPVHGRLFAGVHGRGLYCSKDDGKSWQPAMNGVAHEHVFSLSLIKKGSEVELYAGTEPAHLYRSTDYGETWQELKALQSVAGRENWNFPAPPHVAHAKHVAGDPRDPRRMYVCVEQGALLVSDDAGASFREIHFQTETYKQNKDVHRVIFNPHNLDEIYVPGGDGISRSCDGGKTWEHLTTPEMRLAYPDHFYIPAAAGGDLFAVGGGTPPNMWRQTGNARTAVVTSKDRGKTWQQLRGGLPEEIAGNFEAATMMTWPGGFGFLTGSTDGEIYASFDQGQTWALIAENVGAVSKCVHARNIEIGRAAARQQDAQPKQS